MFQFFNYIISKKSFRFIAILLILTACEGCEEPKPKTELEKLPPATQVGKNTFGCLVNGKAWVTRTSIDAAAFYQDGIFSLGADIDIPSQSIGLSVRELGQYILAEQVYDLSNIPHAAALFIIRKTPICFYDEENTITGVLHVTKFDPSNRIIAGRFEFVTIASNCDTIVVTDGRFDLTYAN
jgi:hypothetical protein